MREKPRRASHVVRVQPYLRREDRQLLGEHCAATQTTASAVMRKALHRYLRPVDTDVTLLAGRVDRTLRVQARTQRDLQLLTETVAVFVKLWLAHTPAVAEPHRAVARASAEARYKQFVDYVSSQFSGGKRFVDDLPQDRVGQERELAELAESVGDAPRAVADGGSDPAGGGGREPESTR